MKVIALNIASPLQSWAEKSVIKTRVDTKRSPSKRALQGLVAAAYGLPRIPRSQKYPSIIENISINEEIEPFTAEELIRLPGDVVRDFQTIGNRADEMEYLSRIGRMLKEGKNPDKVAVANAEGGTSIINRTYLGDARFLVLLQGRSDSETEDILNRLKNPVFSPYFGRKAFAPTFPFILGIFEANEVLNESEKVLRDIQAQASLEIVNAAEKQQDNYSRSGGKK